MQRTTRYVLNRKTDLDIMSALSSGTQYIGTSASTMTLAMFVRARVALALNQVPVGEEDNMYAVISPAAMGYLLQIKEFNAAPYVDVKPLNGPARRFRRWNGFNVIEHPLVPGVGTSAETLFFYHRYSVGHAISTGDMTALAGYHEEQDYSWARTSANMGSIVLQNRGIILARHDGSAYVTTS